MQFEWLKYLCSYYDVSEKEAVKLGTRSSGRKPSLPGSKTCEPVSDMTFEDIWALKERETEKDIFDFYIEQGSWSAFRQCVRHQDLTSFHLSILKNFIKDGVHICEYGCGVAPFSFSLCNVLNTNINVDISLSDVEGCEHLSFGNWRLQKLKEERELNKVNHSVVSIKPNELPRYDKKIDVALIFEVLEHVPSPMKTLGNLMKQMNSKAILVENFIKHEHDPDEPPSCDLMSAALEREQFYEIVNFNFNLIGGKPPEIEPDGTRIWQLKY